MNARLHLPGSAARALALSGNLSVLGVVPVVLVVPFIGVVVSGEQPTG